VLDFVILSLAVFRLSMLLIYDNGPFNMFQRLRIRVGILYYDNGDMIEGEIYKGWAGLLSCVWCLSFWWGLLLVLLHWAFPAYTILFSTPFALSGLTGIYERLVNG